MLGSGEVSLATGAAEAVDQPTMRPLDENHLTEGPEPHGALQPCQLPLAETLADRDGAPDPRNPKDHIRVRAEGYYQRARHLVAKISVNAD